METKKWERIPLRLEFKLNPSDRSPFLLGSVALARKFKRKEFTNDQVKLYLYYKLFMGGINVYPYNFITGEIKNPAYTYYIRGVIEKYKPALKVPAKYRVIMGRIPRIEQELMKTNYAIFLNQL